MYQLFENMVLHEAVPKKAKQLGLNPETPPDLTQPDAGDPNKSSVPPGKQDDPQQQDPTANNDPNTSPPDVDPNSGATDNDPPPNMDDTGDQADPNAGGDPGADGGDGTNPEDPNAEDGQGDGEAPPTDDPNAMDPGATDELGQAEQNLFKDLKPEQLAIKTKELKERFQDLYQVINDTLEKLNKVSKTSYDAVMLNLVIKQLLNLKDLVIQAVTKTFDTRTYVENKIELQKLATVFNAATTTIATVYNSRLKRMIKFDKKPSGKDLNIDFSQDLGF